MPPHYLKAVTQLTTYILYSTAGCHLCEHAKAIIQPLLSVPEQQLHEVDIADSEDLMARYGLTIPVLSQANSSTKPELNWPFDSADVQAWLGQS